MKFVIAFSACILFSACFKDPKPGCTDPEQAIYLKAKVRDASHFCCGNKPDLDFSEDSVRIRMLTNRTNLVYTVVGLPEGFRVQDKKLYVLVTEPGQGDYFICCDATVPFPVLKITAAKERD